MSHPYDSYRPSNVPAPIPITPPVLISPPPIVESPPPQPMSVITPVPQQYPETVPSSPTPVYQQSQGASEQYYRPSTESWRSSGSVEGGNSSSGSLGVVLVILLTCVVLTGAAYIMVQVCLEMHRESSGADDFRKGVTWATVLLSILAICSHGALMAKFKEAREIYHSSTFFSREEFVLWIMQRIFTLFLYLVIYAALMSYFYPLTNAGGGFERGCLIACGLFAAYLQALLIGGLMNEPVNDIGLFGPFGIPVVVVILSFMDILPSFGEKAMAFLGLFYLWDAVIFFPKR